MSLVLYILAAVSLAFAVARLFVIKDRPLDLSVPNLFKLAAHFFVAGLIGAAIVLSYAGPKTGDVGLAVAGFRLWLMIGFLVVVECAAFLRGALKGHKSA